MSVEHAVGFGRKLQSLQSGPLYVTAEEPYDNKSRQRHFSLRRRSSEGVLASYYMQPMPGCCGVAILHTFNGEPKFVAQLIRMGRQAATMAGYGRLVLTLRSESVIIEKLGEIAFYRDDFTNGKTGNRLAFITFPLDPETPKTGKDTDGE